MSSHKAKGSLYKAQGIVLKSVKLGEADKIITFFTDSYGKTSAIAKGLRRTKSKFGGRLEPFTHVDLLLCKGKNLDIITQTEIIGSFPEIRKDLNKITYGLAVLDLVDKISVDDEKDKKVFEFLLSSLRTLSKIATNIDLFLVAFDLKLLSLFGFMPVLNRCVVCDKSVNFFKEVFFSYGRGGLLCERCNHCFDCQPKWIEDDMSLISFQGAGLLSKLLKAGANDFDEIEVSENLKKEVAAVVQRFIDFHIHARLKSRECINELKY